MTLGPRPAAAPTPVPWRLLPEHTRRAPRIPLAARNVFPEPASALQEFLQKIQREPISSPFPYCMQLPICSTGRGSESGDLYRSRVISPSGVTRVFGVCILVHSSLDTILWRGRIPTPPPTWGSRLFLLNCPELQAAPPQSCLSAQSSSSMAAAGTVGTSFLTQQAVWTLRGPKHLGSDSRSGFPFYRRALVSSLGHLRRGCE